MDYQTADSEHLMKRMRTGQSDEVIYIRKACLKNFAETFLVYALLLIFFSFYSFLIFFNAY